MSNKLYDWTRLGERCLLPICLLKAISIYSWGNGNGANWGGGITISTSEGSVVKFQDVKQFKDFKIYVDGLVVDSELPSSDKMKYYELCCSQKMFLHGHLIEGLGSKLVVAMICKTANIAAAIKSLSLVPSPSLQDLERWDNTLKSFEDLGMGVGFLRARIDKLVEISRKNETVTESWYAKSVRVDALQANGWLGNLLTQVK